MKATVRLMIEGLDVRYGSTVALRCASLVVEGNVVAVLGKNGAGKSTLIKTVLGLLEPKTGSVTAFFRFNQGPVEALLPKEDMAFCPEMGSIFQDVTVEQYIQFWCRVRHRDPKYYKREGWSYIDSLEIVQLLGRRGGELSKGERRRVQTAVGFLLKPRLFLFDEPFDGLDVQKTHQLVELIRGHQERITFVVSSHRMDVIEQLADVFLVLRSGSVLCAGGLVDVVTALGGRSYLISSSRDTQRLSEVFCREFPTAVVSRFGAQLRLTGRDLSGVGIRAVAERELGTDILVDELPPSLGDAMTYYLKSPGG